jgi:nucleotide-binding universal stress UspA family protein
VGEDAFAAGFPSPAAHRTLMATPRTILCPSDLSPVGDPAAEVAYAMAGPGGTVHLLHVLEPAVVLSPLDGTPLITHVDPKSERAREKQVEEHLRALAKRAAPEGVSTEVHVVEDTGVAGCILAEAKRRKASAIVMGTHGRTGFGRLLLGSVAGEVLKAKSMRVVLVHAPTAPSA